MAKHRKARGSSKAGRPKKSGDRFPGGKLKAAGPNQLVVQRRRALCSDITKATCPLDVAHANGWISEVDFRTATMFARLHMLANPIGPSPSIVQRRQEVAKSLDVRDAMFAQMPDEEIAALWDAVFNDDSRLHPGARDKAEREARSRWKAAVAAMTSEQFAEVEAVCVRDSWPQWVVQRNAGNMTSGWERKRDFLLDGLRAIRSALRPAAASSAPASVFETMPQPKGRKVAETTVYVDEEGTVLREVVRISRVASK